MKKLKSILKHYKIVFLVPVFESIECAEDLINNIYTICPNSGIILHVNSNSSIEFQNNISKLVNIYDFCYLFPIKYPSDWGHGYLATIYVEMMEWCLKNLSFDYVYQTASNSLMINPLLETRIYDFDGYCYNPGVKNSGDWWDKISLDTNLLRYIKSKDNKIYVCITEGFALSKIACEKLVNDLIPHLPRHRVDYPTEEYWIPTAFNHLKKDIIYKDRCLEKWEQGKDEWINDLALPVDRVSGYTINLMLENKFDVLSNTFCYSLKRIPRVYNDLLRKTIREHFGYSNQIF